MASLQAENEAEAIHALMRSHGWEVYAKHLTQMLADTQSRLAIMPREDLPEMRARWVALGEALDLPKRLITRARQSRQEESAA